jgi:uncharacterized membrane protein
MDANNRESAADVPGVSGRMKSTWLQRSVDDVMQAIIGNVEKIIRAEIHLASTEVTEKARRSRKPATILAGGMAIGVYGAGFLLLGLVYALSLAMAAWLAALLVGAVLALVAVILISSGRKALAQIEPMREQTVQSVKANMQWARE